MSGTTCGIQCPKCQRFESQVIDSRGKDERTIRRRRSCLSCGQRFTTHERIADTGFIDDPKELRQQLVAAARAVFDIAKEIAN